MTSQYRIQIPNYLTLQDSKDEKPFIQYCIIVENILTLEVKSLRFRYKELRNLHDKIVKELERLNIQLTLPPFPGRQVIGNTNAKKESVSQRKIDIEKYLNQLFNLPQVETLSVVSTLLPSFSISTRNGFSKTKKITHSFRDDPSSIFDKGNFRQELFDPHNKKSQILAEIKSFDKEGDAVYYYISFQHLDSNLKIIWEKIEIDQDYDFSNPHYFFVQWEIKCRYNELKNLSIGIKACSNNKYSLPEFPKSHFFQSTNSNPEQIFKRQESLQKYLNEVLDIDDIYQTNESLRNFIESAKRQSFCQDLFLTQNKDINQKSNNVIHQVDKQHNELGLNHTSKFNFLKQYNNNTNGFVVDQPSALFSKQSKLLNKKAKAALLGSGSQSILQEDDF